MKPLLKLRRSLQKFYNKNAVLIRAILKFLLALTVFQIIQMQFQSGNTIRDILLTVAAAGVCAFLSTNTISVVAGIFLLANLASMSMEALGVGGAAIFIIGLLYFGMGPKESASMLLMPVTLWLHIPCLIPVVLGLTSGPAGALGIVVGTVLYYIVQIITGSAFMAVPGSGMDEILKNITGVMGELAQARDLLLMTIILLVVFLIVLMIRRMSVDYAWHFAIGAGIFSYILLTVIGILMLDSGESFISMVVSSVVTVFAGIAVQILMFNVDYRRTERVQFEDDEYYYYVKAVPKIGAKKSSQRQTNRDVIQRQTNRDTVQQQTNRDVIQQTPDYVRTNATQEQRSVSQNRNPSRYDALTPQTDIKEQQRQEWLRRRTEQGGSRYDKKRGG